MLGREAVLVACAVLGAAALGGVLVAALTARRPVAVLPDFDGHLQRWSAHHAGIDPRANRWVVGWLRLMHVLARPLARRGVHPDVLTWAGWWWACAAAVALSAGGRWPLLATVLVVAGAVADGLDGAVAVLTDRSSAWGGVLDSTVDRLADWTLLVGLAIRSGDVLLPVAAGAALALLEYLRARSAAVGADLTEVTVGERATRIVIIAVGAWCAGLVVGAAATVATVTAASVLVVSLVGLVQLAIAARRRLG